MDEWCVIEGLVCGPDDDKDSLIAKLVRHSKGSDSGLKQLDSSSSSSSSGITSSAVVVADGRRKRARKDKAEIAPGNLHGMSVAQLRSLCASWDLLDALPKKAVKADLLTVLEDYLYSSNTDRTAATPPRTPAALIKTSNEVIELLT